jgi:hypothetical protein
VNKTYDNFERETGETGESTDEQGQTTDRIWTVAGFNAQGLAVGDSETTHTTAPGLDVTNTNRRSAMRYDAQGRLSDNDSEQTSSATPALISRSRGVHTDYDQNGRVALEASHDETFDVASDGAALHTVQDSLRTTSYDTKGRLLGYVQMIDDATLGVVTTTEQANTGYNALGLQNGYDQTTRRQSAAAGLDVSTRSSHQVAMFNALGQ